MRRAISMNRDSAGGGASSPSSCCITRSTFFLGAVYPNSTPVRSLASSVSMNRASLPNRSRAMARCSGVSTGWTVASCGYCVCHPNSWLTFQSSGRQTRVCRDDSSCSRRKP